MEMESECVFYEIVAILSRIQCIKFHAKYTKLA